MTVLARGLSDPILRVLLQQSISVCGSTAKEHENPKLDLLNMAVTHRSQIHFKSCSFLLCFSQKEVKKEEAI